jgi:hypothetical protein
LNNTKYNLRRRTHKQNLCNRGLHSDSTTGFKGVSCINWGGHVHIRARITHDCKERHLGYFPTLQDAAKAYDAEAVKMFGEFAKTNKMLGLLN